MPEFTPRLHRRPSLDQLRKQAKELLRLYRGDDPATLARFAAASPRAAGLDRPREASLVDAQFVLARESGFGSWAELKASLESYRDRYERLVVDLVDALRGDPDALRVFGDLFGGDPTPQHAQHLVADRLGLPAEHELGENDARLFVARLYGFEAWTPFLECLEASEGPLPATHGLSGSPPFYRFDAKQNLLEPSPPLTLADWDAILEVMRERGITALRTARMTDAVLARVAKFGHVTHLNLEGSQGLTDAGLRHLAAMPQLQSLNLTHCGMTDAGLAVLAELPDLREFSVYHTAGISDAGLAHLSACDRLERVSVMGCQSGDDLLRALGGKANLRHLKTGDLVTDAGLAHLHNFPVFKVWQGQVPELDLMGFEAEPNYLLPRGRITDEGLAALRGLDGLYALNLDDSRLGLTSDGLRSLATLPHLGWLGFDADDRTMGAIGDLPHLRFLMCQDTRATDSGFLDLSRSRTLQYLWGRRCYGLTGPGFVSLSRIPTLRGLSVSCRNVDDGALAILPEFPSLTDLMPMDVSDAGFRHVGRCGRLERIWCMYCRDTGDAASEHLASLPRLRSYYAGQTQITDRSLEIFGSMNTLERLAFWNCRGVTDDGIASLARLPRLEELAISGMPRISRKSLAHFPGHVRVEYE